MDRRRVLSGLARLVLLGTSLLLVVGFFEMGLRLVGYGAIYDVYSKPSAFWEHDDLLGWVHTESTRGEYIGPRPWPIEFETTIEINSLGMRGPELPASALGEPGEPGEPSEPRELRVLFLGDSMVAGFEVELDETFVELGADRMTDLLGSPVRGLNGGVRGYGTDQSLLYFQHRGRLLAPDVVVFFHSRNDLLNNRTVHKMRRPMGKPAFVPGKGEADVELIGSPTPRYPMCSEYAIGAGGEIVRIDGVGGRLMCHMQLVLLDHSALFSFLTLRIPWDAGMLRDFYYLGFSQKPETRSQRVADRPIAVLTRDLIARLDREVSATGADFFVIGEDLQLEELGAEDLRLRGVDVIGLGDRGDLTVTQFVNDSHFRPAGHVRVVDRISDRLEAGLRARLDEKPASAVASSQPEAS